MASLTARRSVLRGRPPGLGGGRSGAITAHSRSVMSLGYRADTRLWSWRVVSSQAIGSSASQSGGGITTHWYHSTPFRPGSQRGWQRAAPEERPGRREVGPKLGLQLPLRLSVLPLSALPIVGGASFWALS